MSAWQPIETAPKDGSEILVFRKEWPCAPIVFWGEYPGNPVCDEEGADTRMFGWIWLDEFLFTPGEEDGFLGWDSDPMPTHWANRPETPND